MMWLAISANCRSANELQDAALEKQISRLILFAVSTFAWNGQSWSSVREGDSLIVTKLDRLARSVTDLVRITEALKEKRVRLRILATDLDTCTPNGKLMVNLFSSMAEFQRELMLERQREGRAR